MGQRLRLRRFFFRRLDEHAGRFGRLRRSFALLVRLYGAQQIVDLLGIHRVLLGEIGDLRSQRHGRGAGPSLEVGEGGHGPVTLGLHFLRQPYQFAGMLDHLAVPLPVLLRAGRIGRRLGELECGRAGWRLWCRGSRSGSHGCEFGRARLCLNLGDLVQYSLLVV